jgi:hypothetical protein
MLKKNTQKSINFLLFKHFSGFISISLFEVKIAIITQKIELLHILASFFDYCSPENIYFFIFLNEPRGRINLEIYYTGPSPAPPRGSYRRVGHFWPPLFPI